MLAGFYSRNSDGSIRFINSVRSLKRRMASTALLCCLCSVASYGQGSGQGPTGRPADIDVATGTENGRVIGDYSVQQSLEFGGRITEQNGNGNMYNTLVDLQSGPRLFEQSLLIRPITNTQSFFDNIYVQSFGWGGDPSNALRVRMAKHGLYDFRGSFRRDQNYFDNNLLANPLNPVSTNPALPTIFINTSPHSMNLTRRMYDFSLILLPQKTISFRVDYFRNRNEGPSFSTQHIGTEALLDQAWSTTNDTLRLGFSWRVMKRTTLSFTQSLQWLKNDTDYTLSTASPAIIFPTSTGVPVNFGISWLGGSPCATPLIGGLANPVCSGYLAYTRTQQYRSYLPSEQVSLSSSGRRADLNARFMYSNADAFTPYGEIFNGLDSRAGVRAYNNAGSAAHSTWVTEEADAGLTVKLSHNLRFVNSFRFYAHRIPGELYFFQSNFFGTTAANILQPIAIPPTTPFHTSSSPADIIDQFYHRYVQQRLLSNQSELQYDFSRSFGVRAGFQYRDIQDNHDWITNAVANTYLPGGPSITTCLGAGGVLNANGTCTVTGLLDSEFEHFPQISQYWGIVGLWYRMADVFHLDAEARYMTANDFLVRIDPRRQQQYRAVASYTPRSLSWVTIGANVNLLEQRNNTQDFAYNAHNRNFGINVLAAKNNRVAVEAAYNFSNTGQNGNVCYVSSLVVPGSFGCVDGSTLSEALGFYWNHTNYGSASVMFRPIPRVAILAGYSIIDTNGNTVRLNALQPLGSLQSRYQEPLASLTVGIAKGVEFRGGWNYYQYNENSFTGPTLPRYFHANLATLSLRYAF